jgi:uncharacterized protein (TIGR00375 family)
MREVFADLHVHIGAARGRPVKITAARSLTFAAIARECTRRKGVTMVGIVDCASPAVLSEIRSHISSGEMHELPGGGLRYKEKVTVILGSEVEAVEESGSPAHYVCYFPGLAELSDFSRILSGLVKNADLSSQRCFLPAQQVWRICHSTGGFLVPSHSFTPHRSIFGSCARRLAEVFSDEALRSIPAVELGLSADSGLADRIGELAAFTFLSNSDAHSLPNIAREHNLLEVEEPSYRELLLALRRQKGRRVLANYGLDPRLGKYHRTYCLKCERIVAAPPPMLACDLCGGDKVVRGVLDRIVQIQDWPEPRRPEHRPPYVHQVPLRFMPGIGPVMLGRLLNRFRSEMSILHRAEPDELAAVVGKRLASRIAAARDGTLPLQAGGGGRYGRAISTAAESQLILTI